MVSIQEMMVPLNNRDVLFLATLCYVLSPILSPRLNFKNMQSLSETMGYKEYLVKIQVRRDKNTSSDIIVSHCVKHHSI